MVRYAILLLQIGNLGSFFVFGYYLPFECLTVSFDCFLRHPYQPFSLFFSFYL
jgi:hypothetical protein